MSIDVAGKVSASRSAVASPAAVSRADGRARTVAMVGTYPPTACGLATFTSNLSIAIATPGSRWRVIVVRVLDEPEVETHEEVVTQWIAGDRDSLTRSLAAIESSDVVLLQHEYGLFGGRDGQDVLALVGALSKPLIAVLHTVLSNPTPHQREILEQVMAAASLVVVQSKDARQRLLTIYSAVPGSVVVVPHGAEENFSGASQPIVEHPCVLTWGLLGPGKGIEYAIAAMARLGDHVPAPTYIVAGRTHPKVLAAEGERYRRQLQQQCRDLGVSTRVHFDDGYRDWDSLRALIRSADVVLLPYDSLDQESSGVLVEALASGKPVVATMFPHALELLSRGAGVLVRQRDVDAMSAALERVLYEPGLAEKMKGCARREATALLWPTIGATYRSLISHVVSRREVM
jgi:glycosyltransferase involved in cell wall biosynthesis